MSTADEYLRIREAFLKLQVRFTRAAIIDAIQGGRLDTWLHLDDSEGSLKIPSAYWREKGSKALPRKGGPERFRIPVRALNKYVLEDVARVSDPSQAIEYKDLIVLCAWEGNRFFPLKHGSDLQAVTTQNSFLTYILRQSSKKKDVLVKQADIASFVSEEKKKSKGGAPMKAADDGFWIHLIEEMGVEKGIITQESLANAMHHWLSNRKVAEKNYTKGFVTNRVAQAMSALREYRDGKKTFK